jgi:hypothetical protein
MPAINDSLYLPTTPLISEGHRTLIDLIAAVTFNLYSFVIHLDQPVEYFRMALVILILALEITGPHTHQTDLLLELNSFKAGEYRFS